MRRYVVWMFAAAVLGGCKERNASGPQAATAAVIPAGMAPPSMAPPGVASVGFHLEIGAVHERYQDAKGAAEHYARAAAVAEDGAQRARAHAAVARAKEASGNRAGAIEALERARQELGTPGASARPSGTAGAGPLEAPGDDILVRLARLYLLEGRQRDAETICNEGLAAAGGGWERQELLRVQVELLRRSGALEQKVSERERALEAPAPDEADLRFVVAALDGGERPPPVGGAGEPGRAGLPQPRLVRAYQRLLELHPEDPQVRQALQAALERSGRVDEAVRLATGARSRAVECLETPSIPPPSGAFWALAEAARIRMRAGQTREALAELAKAASRVKGEGTPFQLALAQLYLELGDAGRARGAIDQGAREARSAAERRQVAFARERAVALRGSEKERAALRAEWRRSADPCLRAASGDPQPVTAQGPEVPLAAPSPLPFPVPLAAPAPQAPIPPAGGPLQGPPGGGSPR